MVRVLLVVCLLGIASVTRAENTWTLTDGTQVAGSFGGFDIGSFTIYRKGSLILVDNQQFDKLPARNKLIVCEYFHIKTDKASVAQLKPRLPTTPTLVTFAFVFITQKVDGVDRSSLIPWHILSDADQLRIAPLYGLWLAKLQEDVAAAKKAKADSAAAAEQAHRDQELRDLLEKHNNPGRTPF